MKLPSLAEVKASARTFRLPLRVPFRGLTNREGMLFEGPSGFAEFAPFPEYGDELAARWLAAAIEAGWGAWPPAVRSHVPVNAIVPGVSGERAAQLVVDAVRQFGCQTVKVKVGDDSLDRDCERVAAVKTALHDVCPAGLIRVDANGAWTVDQAVVAIRELDRVAGGLEYVEQPVRTLVELASVRRAVDVPIAADESIRLATDVYAAARAAAVDVVVLKVAPLGGVAPALAVAESAGIPAVVSGAMDTAVGLSAGVALAAALPELPYACGLGTGALLARDVVAPPLVPTAGALAPSRAVPTQADLAVVNELPAERAAWWVARLESCFALLDQ